MNPITLRQTFQSANVEALREAQGFNGGLVREAVHRKADEDRISLENTNVPEITHSEAPRTEERQGRGRQSGEEPGGEAGDEAAGDRGTPDGEGLEAAGSADHHLDFLA